jgi:hypothetical protein
VHEGHFYRIETFDPLLRDLVAWGLVSRTEAEDGPSWELTDAAQRRLEEIIRPASPLDVDELVYLDHLCADCRFRGITKLHDGVYLCDACLARRLAEVPDQPPAARRWPWRRHRQDTNGSASRAV